MSGPTPPPPDNGLNPPENNSSSLKPPRTERPWQIDEIVVSGFAILGFAGAIFLPLKYTVPPIEVAFLLATGLAALTYRYLGGIPAGTSFKVGALKLSGALAALVGIALLINYELVSQTPRFQVWEVRGQVTDEGGTPIQPLDVGDVILQPPPLQPSLEGKFKLDFYSWSDLEGKTVFPVLGVSHDGFNQHPIDLDPDASADVEIKRTGHKLEIKRITLHPHLLSLKTYQPPPQTLQPVPYAIEVHPSESHQ